MAIRTCKTKMPDNFKDCYRYEVTGTFIFCSWEFIVLVQLLRKSLWQYLLKLSTCTLTDTGIQFLCI